MVRSTSVNAANFEHAPPCEDFLVVENVSKSFTKPDGTAFTVLEDINLTVGEQEYVSVIGHSGCGKSTLLRLVAGLVGRQAG